MPASKEKKFIEESNINNIRNTMGKSYEEIIEEEETDTDIDDDSGDIERIIKETQEAIAHQLVVSYNLYKAIKELKNENLNNNSSNYFEKLDNSLDELKKENRKNKKLLFILFILTFINFAVLLIKNFIR